MLFLCILIVCLLVFSALCSIILYEIDRGQRLLHSIVQLFILSDLLGRTFGYNSIVNSCLFHLLLKSYPGNPSVSIFWNVSPNTHDYNHTSPGHVTVKLLKMQDKEGRLHSARRKCHTTFRDKHIRQIADISEETECQRAFLGLKDNNNLPRLYPIKLSFTSKGEVKTFQYREILRESTIIRPEFQKMI